VLQLFADFVGERTRLGIKEDLRGLVQFLRLLLHGPVGVAAPVEVHPVERHGADDYVLDRARGAISSRTPAGADRLVMFTMSASAVQDGHVPALQRVRLGSVPGYA